MASPSSEEDVGVLINDLKLSPGSKTGKRKAAKTEVADSWEDEADGSSGTETEFSTPIRPSTSEIPAAPPPTPASPSPGLSADVAYSQYQPSRHDTPFTDTFAEPTSKLSTGELDRRPEKSTAVAARLIAAGIGQKMPRRTQEQKDYDRAIRLQEKKKRDDAREAEEKKQRDKEKALRDVWND